GAVVREKAKRLRPRSETRENGDAERGVRGKAARPRDLPEEEIHLGLLGDGHSGLCGGAHGGGKCGRRRGRRRGHGGGGRRCCRRRAGRRDRGDRGGLKRRVRHVEVRVGVPEGADEDAERREETTQLQPPGRDGTGSLLGTTRPRPRRDRREGGGIGFHWYMDTGLRALCFEKQLRVGAAALFSYRPLSIEPQLWLA